jgi:YqaJ-like recombinase protein
MKIFDCKQLSPEWFELHRGIPTASQADMILTPKTAKMSASSNQLIHELVAQMFGAPMDPGGYVSREMQEGLDREEEARRWYTMETGRDVVQVGFVTTDDGRWGCSPDGLIGSDGMLEMKNPGHKAQVRYLLDGGLPPEYIGQCHMSLVVTSLKWLDFLSYCPGLPPLLVRVEPTDYTEKMRAALDDLWERYQTALAQIRSMT